MAARSMHDLPTSDDPTQVLAHSPASLAGLPITVIPIPGQAELIGDFHPAPCIYVAQSGTGRRWYTRGGNVRQLRTSPRMVEVYEAQLEFERSFWEGQPGRCVRVQFADQDVQAMTHGQVQSLKLRTQHELFDERVSRLTLELANEALFGHPQGELYVQGLCVALVGALHQSHSQRPQQVARVARTLTADQQRRVTELVAAEFGSKLSLARMAAEVHLSPHHFARLFKVSFGVTPHEYVQQVRLDAAVRALREGMFPSIAAVAIACGFSSHSHMADLLRRKLGSTPTALRRN